jgi:hypothetical protein
LIESRGYPGFKASKGEAVVAYRKPLAIRRRLAGYGGTGAEDGVPSAFPACWVVAESEAQRANKMGFKIDIYNEPIEALIITSSI